ncbi:MAG: nuclear transport factor 2 family protein [Acidimicrobiaceae bacterium]|nr:nuclear transport factor 2 family protein [Acidimicrobiaceae bacterium]
MSDTRYVQGFVERYGAHDFDGVADCLSDEGFERSGPYLDVIASKEEYVAFLKRVVPTLGPRYELAPVRISGGDDGTTAFAELIERVEVDGALTDIPEIIVFDLAPDGRIARMNLFLKQPGGVAPAGGRDAMGST